MFGGALNIEGEPMYVKHFPLKYDGRKLHFVEPFDGTRYSLTFFTAARHEEASPKQRKVLADMGFPLPCKAEHVSKPASPIVSGMHENCTDLYFPRKGTILIELGLSCGAMASAFALAEEPFAYFFLSDDEENCEVLTKHFLGSQRIHSITHLTRALEGSEQRHQLKVLVFASVGTDLEDFSKRFQKPLKDLDGLGDSLTSAIIFSDTMEKEQMENCGARLENGAVCSKSAPDIPHRENHLPMDRGATFLAEGHEKRTRLQGYPRHSSSKGLRGPVSSGVFTARLDPLQQKGSVGGTISLHAIGLNVVLGSGLGHL